MLATDRHLRNVATSIYICQKTVASPIVRVQSATNRPSAGTLVLHVSSILRKD